MEITTEHLENRQLRLTITVDEERVQQAMQRAARRISQQVNLPGFRKGKAPYDLIIERYGEDAVREEAAEILAPELYKQALDEKGIEPYAPGKLDKLDLRPFTFHFIVPLPPLVELGDYRAYRLKPPKVKVDKKEVQEALEHIREQNAILERVNRPAQIGDTIVANLEGKAANGETLISAQEVHIILENKEDDIFPGLEEAAVGMQEGETRTFTLTLPDHFPQPEHRGKEACLTLHLLEVYQRTLPNIDDDLARAAGNYDSLKELREAVEQQLLKEAQEQADREYAATVVNALVEMAKVEYPPIMLEEELNEMVKEIESFAKRKGQLSLEDHLRLQHKTLEDLRRELEPQAAARLKRALVLGEIARLEGIEVDEAEVAAQIDKISAEWGERANDVRQVLSSEQEKRELYSRLVGTKVVRWLTVSARGEDPQKALVEKTGEAS